jgi:hypothetical protein
MPKPPCPFRSRRPATRRTSSSCSAARAACSLASTRAATAGPGLRRIDECIADTDGEQARVADQLAEAQERRRTAEQRHEEAVGAWLASGQQGLRPVSEAAELDERIAQLQVEHAGYDHVRDKLLEERIRYVSRRRKTLVADASKATDERLARYRELVAELEQTREELIALRQTALWAALYPSETLSGQEPFPHALVGARLKIQSRYFPGITAMLSAHSVFELLRADAEHCASVATVEQATALSGDSALVIGAKEAQWQDQQFDRDLEQREKQAKIDAYVKEWGVPPSEWA